MPCQQPDTDNDTDDQHVLFTITSVVGLFSRCLAGLFNARTIYRIFLNRPTGTPTPTTTPFSFHNSVGVGVVVVVVVGVGLLFTMNSVSVVGLVVGLLVGVPVGLFRIFSFSQ